MRVLLLVTHLLGSGHLSRALVLARSFAQAGDEVAVISGGMPAPHLASDDVRLIQLPPLRSDGTDFARLLDDTGRDASADLFAARAAQICAAVSEFAPDILITELFPFGRRSLRAEFIAALETTRQAQKPVHVFASVRDILAPPSKPRKADFADDMLRTYYDGVLVHADPSVVTLEASWPISETLRSKLLYTGFVASPLPSLGPDATGGTGEILVSAGGGAVGAPLYEAALSIAARDDRPWRLLVGGHDATERITVLQQSAPANAIVEPARPDFRSLLQRCAASISLTGYNTAMDVLQAGTPAVMVAFDDGNEVEQTLRAAALSHLRQLETLPLRGINADDLERALSCALSGSPTRDTQFDFDGARRTRTVCLEAIER